MQESIFILHPSSTMYLHPLMHTWISSLHAIDIIQSLTLSFDKGILHTAFLLCLQAQKLALILWHFKIISEMVSFVSDFHHGKCNYGYKEVLGSSLSLATKFIYFILQVICSFWAREPILLWFIIMQIFQGFIPPFQRGFITPLKSKN